MNASPMVVCFHSLNAQRILYIITFFILIETLLLKKFLCIEGYWTQTIWSQGWCIQFRNSAMGAVNWRSKPLCVFFSFIVLLVSVVMTHNNQLYIERLDMQLPYSLLTPLQAAVGVVQQVCIILFLIPFFGVIFILPPQTFTQTFTLISRSSLVL